MSLSSWQGIIANNDFVGLKNYRELFDNERFQIDIRNVLVFTVVFVVGSLAAGFFMGLLLEKGVRFEGFFRSVYLFPMAISFIATAIIWRWLLNNSGGRDTTGLNRIFDAAHLGFLKSDWHKSDSKFAIAAIALPAGWALSGYVMSLFLAGMRGGPDELRTAARADGANEPPVFWYVLRPMLLPVIM